MTAQKSSTLRGFAHPDHLPRIRPWRELAVIAVLVMELTWVIPWYRSLTRVTYAVPPGQALTIFFSIWLVAYLSVRFFASIRLRLDVRKWVTVGLIGVSILAGLNFLLYEHEIITMREILTKPVESIRDLTNLIPDEFIIIVTVLVLWWRGATLAQEKMGPRLVIADFQIGILMFIGFVFINTLATGEQVGNLIHLFLFASLLGMGAARVSVLRTLRGGKKNPFDRRWLTGLAFAVIGAVGLAAGLAAMVSGEEAILGFLPRLVIGAVMGVAGLILFPMMLGLLYVLYGVAENIQDPNNEMFQALTELIGNLQNAILALSDILAERLAFLEPFFRFLYESSPIIKTLIGWGVIAGIIGIILLLLHIRQRRLRLLESEDTDSLLANGDLWKMLQAAWKKRLQDAANRLARATDLRNRQRLLAAAKVRQIYGSLMHLCADLQHPRPEAETPLEFLPSMTAHLFPDHKHELALITNAYVKVRYGELPESRGEIREVEGAWRIVRVEGIRLKRELGKREATKNLDLTIKS